MGTIYCKCCARTTEFLTIRRTMQIAGVSRSTIYYWMKNQWVHWQCLPSLRRVICSESLCVCVPGNDTHKFKSYSKLSKSEDDNRKDIM